MSLFCQKGYIPQSVVRLFSESSFMSRLYDITPFTLLDYPGETSCIAWFAGCNMRCVYCHNPSILLSRGEKEDAELLAFLEKRRGLLSAVVFSGGEATLNEGLPEVARKAKDLGYKIKLDTNGTRPEVLTRLWKAGALDYVALDYKTPPDGAKALLGSAKHQKNVDESLTRLIAYAAEGLKFEVRTTFHADLMTVDDLAWILDALEAKGYKGTYYIQNIVSHGEKTFGKIAKPASNAAPKNLPEPRDFEIAFRNFA